MIRNHIRLLSQLFTWRASLLLALSAAVLTAQEGKDSENRLPLFELDEVEVLHSPTDFSPSFKGDSPQMSYFDVPRLPGGDLVIALEFMDRYRETLVPGSAKWAGMLFFPVIDGENRWYLKYICLYFYDDMMYGFDPGALSEWDRRFRVPIRYEDRRNNEALFRFATNYVEQVFPDREEEYYYVEIGDSFDPEGSYEETVETIYIPQGRIAGFLSMHKGKEPEELVRLVYEHSEMPNPGSGSAALMGKADKVGKTPFSWSGLWAELTAVDDHIQQAAEMLQPRWTQEVKFHYEKGVLFWDIKARSQALLFNIGPQVFTYSPKFGVWRTEATLYDLEDMDVFTSKLQYPGVQKVLRVEFVEPELAAAQSN